ncbi:MAG: MFS transporter, partial [Myxococcales bacterium]
MLSTLYLVQGLPAGFQATALPVYLRGQSMSRTSIALLGLLALPWSFKALWAPLVDTYWVRSVGRRRSWIVPMQVALCAACVGAALTPVPGSLMLFLGLVLLMNLFAATMDIAVDGLAVDLLEPH